MVYGLDKVRVAAGMDVRDGICGVRLQYTLALTGPPFYYHNSSPNIFHNTAFLPSLRLPHNILLVR
jgi:hypothetical protein